MEEIKLASVIKSNLVPQKINFYDLGSIEKITSKQTIENPELIVQFSLSSDDITQCLFAFERIPVLKSSKNLNECVSMAAEMANVLGGKFALLLSEVTATPFLLGAPKPILKNNPNYHVFAKTLAGLNQQNSSQLSYFFLTPDMIPCRFNLTIVAAQNRGNA